jgi:hypothetical protein
MACERPISLVAPCRGSWNRARGAILDGWLTRVLARRSAACGAGGGLIGCNVRRGWVRGNGLAELGVMSQSMELADQEIWSNNDGGSVSSTTVSPSCGISSITAFTTELGESPAGKTMPSISELRIRLTMLDCVAESNG